MNIRLPYPSKVLREAVLSEFPENGSSGSGSSEIDDSVLVSRAQQGDYKAFDALVTRHRGKVYAMIVNMVKNDADAWDLAQDAFIKAWKSLGKFENRSQFSTWLFRISHNVVYDWMRKKRLRSEGEFDEQLHDMSGVDQSVDVAPSRPSRPDEDLIHEELRGEIEAALAKLSDEQREVIILREVQGMDYKEIADIQQCTLGTVMSRLFYARKKLQTLINR